MRADLPNPGPDELAHSAKVAQHVRTEIDAAGGAIDFSHYMEQVLYAPGLGYYSAGATKFGAAGDFITAPELGFVFARCLARAIAPTLRETNGDVLELGPGSGVLAAELLLELERLDALPRRYRLLERSADLRDRQRDTIARRCTHLLDRCEWLDAPPRNDWNGVLVANEVVDALPVRLFTLRDDGIFERKIAIDEANHFIWKEVRAEAAFSAMVTSTLGEHRGSLPRPYRSEICPLLAPWFAEVAGTLRTGRAIFIDYGCTRDELYNPQRREGTLLCHYRHRAHHDPLILLGIQDITAWVDFDALANAAKKEGFVVESFQHQSEFLIRNELETVFAQVYAELFDEASRYRLAQEVKTLTLPSEMGSVFRAITFTRTS
jgi:SAM-dependent MidA family methyltransferase